MYADWHRKSYEKRKKRQRPPVMRYTHERAILPEIRKYAENVFFFLFTTIHTATDDRAHFAEL